MTVKEPVRQKSADHMEEIRYVTGYEIQYSVNKNQIRSKNSVRVSKTKYTLTKLPEKQNVIRKDPHKKSGTKEILFFLEQGKSSKDQKSRGMENEDK